MHLSYQIIKEEKVNSLEEVLFSSYQRERERLRKKLNRGEISSVQYRSALEWVEIMRKAL